MPVQCRSAWGDHFHQGVTAASIAQDLPQGFQEGLYGNVFIAFGLRRVQLALARFETRNGLLHPCLLCLLVFQPGLQSR